MMTPTPDTAAHTVALDPPAGPGPFSTATPINWIILFLTDPNHDESTWEPFTGTRYDAEKYATADGRHLNYGRRGFKLVPDVPTLPQGGQSGVVATVVNYPEGTGPAFATVQLRNGMLVELGDEGFNVYARAEDLGTTTQPVAGVVFNDLPGAPPAWGPAE